MKRLISWLLALTMIMSLPLSAFAVGIDDGNSSWDEDVDFGDLVGPTYIDLDTVVTMGPGSTFEVTVPAGEAVYYKGGARYAGLAAIIDGETEILLTRADDGFVYLTIANETEEAKTYTVVVNYPLGSMDNPKVIEEMAMYSDEVAQAAGDSNGFFYTYTAKEAGTVTLYFNAVYDENGDLVENVGIRDIKVTNNNTYAQYSLQQDGVDNYGLELQVPVAAGDQLIINTAWVTDAAGNYYPEATYSWTGNFAYPAGSDKNPIAIEWAWSDDGLTATATVNVPEGETQFFAGISGMDLTANGAPVAMSETGVFSLTTGEYALVLSTPVGAFENPEVIENIDGYTDSNSLGENEAYYYIWTATEDGTVTLNITNGANITVNNQNTYAQSTLAEVDYDENYNPSWSVAQNLTVEVKAGETLKIEVVGLLNFETYTTPAIDYTLTGSFEAAVKCDHDAIANGKVCDKCGKFKLTGTTATLGNALAINFVVTMANLDSTDASHYAVITKEYADGTEDAVVTIPQSAWTNYGSESRKYFTFDGIRAKEMTDALTVVIYNSNNEAVSIEWIDSMRDYGMRALVNEEKKASPDAEKLTLYVDMLNYGAAAQVYFENYHSDDYANSQLSDAQKAYATGDVTLTQDAYYKGNYQLGATLTLASNIVLNFVYNTSVNTTMYAVATYTDHNGVAQEVKIEGSKFTKYGSKGWIVPLESLKIADLNTKVTLTVYTAEGEEVTYSTDSIAAYLARVASNDLYVAIAKFATSAYNSFH